VGIIRLPGLLTRRRLWLLRRETSGISQVHSKGECGMDNSTVNKDPRVALMLSFLITGAGQMYYGDEKRAAIFFLGACFLGGLGATVSPLFFTLLIVLWVINLVDAYNLGETGNPSPLSYSGSPRSRRSDIISILTTIRNMESLGALTNEEGNQARETALADADRPENIEGRLALIGRASVAHSKGFLRKEDVELIKEKLK
jgi:TM2 domain-containing membrane protein YozV